MNELTEEEKIRLSVDIYKEFPSFHTECPSDTQCSVCLKPMKIGEICLKVTRTDIEGKFGQKAHHLYCLNCAGRAKQIAEEETKRDFDKTSKIKMIEAVEDFKRRVSRGEQ